MWNYTKQNKLLKELYILDRSLKKIDRGPGYCIFRVCKDF